MAGGEIQHLTVYLRHTIAKGVSFVQEHSVWNKEKFIAAQRKAAQDKNPDGNCEQVTKEVFEVEKLHQ